MELELTNRLSALSHPQRMAVFRLLVRRCPDALPAGEIATTLNLKPSTTSVYLATLNRASLIKQDRHGTSLRYQLDIEGAQGLVSDLFLDCCRGRPNLCPPALFAPQTECASQQKTRNVLFICTGNSARSIFAEAILRHEGKGRFIANSAGTKPNSELNPFAIKTLESCGIDASDLHTKNVTQFQQPNAPKPDFVFTVCDSAANEECRPWDGLPISAHWGLPDPATATGSEPDKRRAFQRAFDTMRRRVLAFSALPFDALDRASLQKHVDDIGRT